MKDENYNRNYMGFIIEVIEMGEIQEVKTMKRKEKNCKFPSTEFTTPKNVRSSMLFLTAQLSAGELA